MSIRAPMRKNLFIVLLYGLFLTATLSHCATADEPPPTPAIDAWVACPAVKVDSSGKPLVMSPLEGYRAKNAVYDASSRIISLAAAANEYVAFQVILQGGPDGLNDASLAFSSLTSASSSIPPESFASFVEFYTRVTVPSFSPGQSLGPGWYPDGLIPMSIEGHSTVSVSPDAVQAIWVDLYVPPGAAAGRYDGKVQVSAPGRVTLEFPLVLEVYDFELPAESHMRWHVGYNEHLADRNDIPFDRQTSLVTDEFLALELDFYRLCRRHRITPTTHYTSPLPESTGKGDSLTIDWASYDRRFGRYLDGTAFEDGIPVNIFSLPVNPLSYSGWPSSARYTARVDLVSFRKAVKLTVEHWDAKGWDIGDTFIFLGDVPDPDRYNLIKDHCRIVREIDPRIRRTVAWYDTFGANALNIVAEFRSYVTHWEVAGDYLNLAALESVRSRGDWLGFYQGSEPFQGSDALDNDGLSFTTWPWIARLYGLDTLLLFNSTEWNTDDIWTQPVNQAFNTNSRGVIVYPGLKFGVKRALPSIRLKQIRRGMQDYEYFYLLDQCGRGDLADAVVKRIIRSALDSASTGNYGDEHYSPGKWERDPAKWDAARSEMAAAIIKARAAAAATAR